MPSVQRSTNRDAWRESAIAILHSVKDRQTFHNRSKILHLEHGRCTGPLQRPEYRYKIDVALANRAVGVRFSQVIVDMHVAKRGLKELFKTAVEPGMAGVQRKAGIADQREVLRVLRLKKFMFPMFSNQNVTPCSRAARFSSLRTS